MSEEKYTPGPWSWTIYDHSIMSLTGPREDEDHVVSISPCGGCIEASRRDEESKIDWTWGRCITPSLANGKLMAAAPELLEALIDEIKNLKNVRHSKKSERCMCAKCRNKRCIEAITKAGIQL
jgi:hypothetical protein